MATQAQTTQITADTRHVAWTELNSSMRSDFVLQWCKTNSVKTTLTATQLQAAMKNMPYWAQGPQDYLDFVTAFDAAIEAKGE